MMQVINRHVVKEGQEPQRIYDYLNQVFEQLPSRKSLKKALSKQLIQVDGEVVGSGYFIKGGSVITLHENGAQRPKAYDMKIEVLWDDDYLSIVYKPAGISVSGNQYRTMQNVIVDQLPASTQTDALNWPKPVHRLDNPTSGLLVIAKTAQSIIALGDRFKNNEIQKTYHAIVVGSTPNQGSIDEKVDELEAFTSYEKVKEVPSLKNEAVSLLKVQPKTGRTHQIRKHLLSIQHPIMGDPIYGEKDHTLTGKGLFLCATGIQFQHPVLNEMVKLEIPLPHKFHSLLEREERRWHKFRSKDKMNL